MISGTVYRRPLLDLLCQHSLPAPARSTRDLRETPNWLGR